jgi:hypothetical protein
MNILSTSVPFYSSLNLTEIYYIVSSLQIKSNSKKQRIMLSIDIEHKETPRFLQQAIKLRIRWYKYGLAVETIEPKILAS